jgi:PPM family protein phosphatase
MRLVYGAASDAGRRRRENEDSLLVDFDAGKFPADPALFLVCDGVGGAVAGKTASTLAVNQMARAFRDSKSASLSERLIEAAELASAQIFEHALTHPATEGMATTLVAAAFDARACQIVNVGDSRAYRLAAGRLERLTTDHTLVQEQVTSGLLSPEEATESPYRHIITRSLGREPSNIGVQGYPAIPIAPGDRFILCSDGLTEMVEESEILQIASAEQADAAAQHLVELANRYGGQDNVTVIVIEVTD